MWGNYGRIDLALCRGIAQLVEHRSPKPGVGGSSPSAPAKFIIKIAYLGGFSRSLYH